MKNNFDKIIVNKIKANGIKMRPKWWFQLGFITRILAYWIVLTLASIGAKAIGYFFELYRPGEIYEFSELGWSTIMEDFPAITAGCLILGIMTGWILLLNIGENYKKTKLRLFFINILLILIMLFLLKIGF